MESGCYPTRAEANVRVYTAPFIMPHAKTISFEKINRNTLHVHMLASGAELKSREMKRERRSRTCSVLSATDEQYLDSMDKRERPRLRKRFLSTHQSQRRRHPLDHMSPSNSFLFDDAYNGQVQCLLKKVSRWDFDIFKLDRLSNGRPVFAIAMNLFQHYDLINHFHLQIEKVMHCIRTIEEGYHVTNPYHNAIHAADVTQSMHCFLQQTQVSELLTPQDILVTLLASLSHDIDHPGVNNTFLVATENHLATLYNNVSVLENHHWRTALALLKQTDILHGFSSQQWTSFCDQLRSLILATDISRQQEFIASFNVCLADESTFSDPSSKYTMLQIALKCSDISNTCREWTVSKHWSDRVCDEFFKQGDCEKLLNLPITPMCNKSLTTTPNIQIGFMHYVVSPLVNSWHLFCPSSHSDLMLSNLRGNIQRWRQWGMDNNIPLEHEKLSNIVVHEDVQDVVSDDASDDDDDNDDADVTSSSSIHDLLLCLAPLAQDEHVEITQYHSVTMPDSGMSASASGRLSPGRSLSPVCEDFPSDLINSINKRRHSMPITALRKEQTRLTIRRESFPRTLNRRRCSLPPRAGMTSSSSYDQIIGKLQLLETAVSTNTKSTSLDMLFSRPKVSNLSPQTETSKLISHLTKFQSLHCVSSKPSSEIHSTEPTVQAGSESASTRRRASLPVSETAREYLTRQLVDVATLFSCLDPTSQSYERTLAASKFYTNGLTEPSTCRSRIRSNSMFEITQNHLNQISFLQQCSK